MSLHDDMTRIVKKHLPAALFGRPATEQAQASCQCGAELVGDKTPEELYADHVVQALEDSGVIPGTQPEFRAGQQVIIDAPTSIFDGQMGYFVGETASILPYRVRLDNHPRELGFFKHEVVRSI